LLKLVGELRAQTGALFLRERPCAARRPQ
jgi:hypothetical protein